MTDQSGRLEGLFALFDRFWLVCDERDVDKHLMSWLVFAATGWIIRWATIFVDHHPDKPGLEVAAIIAAVMVPWTPVQAAVIAWYFQARTA